MRVPQTYAVCMQGLHDMHAACVDGQARSAGGCVAYAVPLNIVLSVYQQSALCCLRVRRRRGTYASGMSLPIGLLAAQDLTAQQQHAHINKHLHTHLVGLQHKQGLHESKVWDTLAQREAPAATLTMCANEGNEGNEGTMRDADMELHTVTNVHLYGCSQQALDQQRSLWLLDVW